MAPVALILGAGPKVGQSVSRAFAAKGYKVALAARSVKEEDSTSEQLLIKSDFSKPESIETAFETVKSKLGLPHVVVYNAAAAHFGDAKHPLGLSLDDFKNSLAINTTSVFVAAQQAVLAFDQLPNSASRTFIYTGNGLPFSPSPAMLDLGVGKAATYHIIQCAAEGYKDKGYKFYFADERQPDGGLSYKGVDGPAHAEMYLKLAEDPEQGPSLHTFIKGVGYKKV